MIVLADVGLLDRDSGGVVSHDIGIDGETVCWIGLAGGDRPDSAEIVDGSGKLAIPGLVNAHTHSHAVAMRGLADRWCLEMSLAYAPWAVEAQDDELIYWTAYIGAAEMALGGVTACYDLVLLRPPLTARAFSLVAQAYSDIGLRAVLAPMVSDVSLYDAVPGVKESMPAEAAARADRYRPAPAVDTLAACRDVFQGWAFDPAFVKPAIAPTILNHCTPDFLDGCLALKKEFGLQVHMHVAESALQRHTGERLYGHSLVAELASRGVLGPDFCAAHCVWIDADDRARLADSGAAMAHIPVSNLRLGAGVAPIVAARERGIPIGLATDGGNSADALSMFEVMKQATLVSRLHGGHRPEEWLSAHDALAMATEGGAGLVQFPGVTGRLEEGAAADITLLDLGSFAFTPL
ncbi:MAG: amidohydrolase family protein, partial [Alphaproteobacteria bacterium]|nr:amidohydrolase family protein [Alphaproteobacteria bacterium]